MLVLSRKIGERIMIGADIILTLVSIDRGIARIGIEAPKGVVILREELVKALEREGKCSNCKVPTDNSDLCDVCEDLAKDIEF